MEEEKLTDQEQARKDKLPKYVALGVDPFGSRYEWKDRIIDIRKTVEGKTPEDLQANKITVNVAGRLVAIRRMGKASFVNLKDEYGVIQAWIGIDVIGEHDYEVFKLADLGDIVGLEGTLMFSRTGELTIRVNKYTHITKCLKPLPEKFHGILKANKIAVTDVKEWGVKDFAYVIKKQTKGYYVVIKANGEAKGLAEFDRLVRLDPLVIRHLITIDQD